MANTSNTKGIVLQYVPWQEYDRLYTIYTERFGKQRLRAHGVQKISSKLAGSLEPFAEIDLYMIEAKGMPKVGGAVVVKRFAQLTSDLAVHNAAWYVVDLVNRLTEEDEPDAKLYQLLYSILTWINVHGAHQAVLRGFVVKLIRQLGYDAASEAPDADSVKVIRWCYEQSFEEIQKIRFTKQQWANIVQTINQWLYTHSSGHIQSEKFLVY